MDIGVHQVAERLVDQAVARQWAQPAESAGDYPQTEMTAAIARPGVSHVLVAVVDDLDVVRRQRFEARAHPGNAITGGHRLAWIGNMNGVTGCNAVAHGTESAPSGTLPLFSRDAAPRRPQPPPNSRTSMSRRIAIHPVSPQQRLIDQAVAALRAGELLVYPTDSGYAFGFALDARDALERVVRLRQLRPRHNFTLACRDLKHIGQYARVDDAAFRLMRAHLPGGYTFILPASSLVPKRVATEKRRSIGVRVPDNRVAQALIETLGEPILSSSLLLPNQDLHGMEVDELVEALDSHVDVFVDSGPCGVDPTTVVSMIDQPYEVLRHGSGPVDWE